MARTAIQRDSFILRIWREGESQAWKGWVQHTSSGATTPIHTPADLLAFIEQHTGREILNSTHYDVHAEGAPSAHNSKKRKTSGLK
jgi:hypothetical protein